MISVLCFFLEIIPMACELIIWNLKNYNRASVSIAPEVLNFVFKSGSIIAINIIKF